MEEQAARVGKSLLTHKTFVVLEKFGIFLLQKTPEKNGNALDCTKKD